MNIYYSPEKFQNFLSLLIENNSKSIASLLDKFYEIINFEHLQFIFEQLARLSQPDCSQYKIDIIEQIINSRAFKTIFYDSVKSSGFNHYTSSFQEFFE